MTSTAVSKSSSLVMNMIQQLQSFLSSSWLFSHSGLRSGSSLPLLLTLGAAVPAWLVYYAMIRPFFTPLRKMPGPPVRWWTGVGHVPIIIKEEAGAPFLRWARQYGGVVRYHHMFNQPRVLVSSSTGLKRVLGTHTHIYVKAEQQMKFLRGLLGVGLLTVQGDVHKRQRAIINPVFRVKNIAAMVPTFSESGRELVRTWQNTLNSTAIDANGGDVKKDEFTIDIYEEMSKVTLDVIGKAGFEYDFSAVANVESPLFTAYQVVMGNLTLSFRLILENLFPFLRSIPSKRRTELANSQKIIENQVYKIIESRREKMKKAGEKGLAGDGKDLLSILLKANEEETDSKKRLTDEELFGQVMTFLAAGHETTSVALSWTLHLLATNPDIQQRLRAEIRATVRDSDSELTYEQVNNMPFLDAVAKESMRVIPPVPITIRVTAQDDVLDGYKIPKGTVIAISPRVVQSLEEYWGEDADKFDPNRWLHTSHVGADDAADGAADATAAGRPFGAYMPFLLGPRNCIGSRFALLELKVLLLHLIQNFKFNPVPGLEVRKKLMITWKPFPTLKLNVSRAE
ncbi:hypothetical protein HDU76_007926 [Blyttiomyces sp. JEL0837]|nr:hypothetical protein HDU76_007926 [Blyttiomyces sp. JEL0837]